MNFDITSIEVRGSPCSTEEIKNAEKILGHPLPAELLNIYLNANGFRGPTYAAFLYPLLTQQKFNSETLVNFTLQLRKAPSQPKFWQHAIAFGDFGVGATWGFDITNGQVFEWWPDDGEAIAFLGESITEVWGNKKKWYEENT